MRVDGTPGHEHLYVRWEDDHESLLLPGAGVEILQHFDPYNDVHAIGHAQGWGPLWD